MREQFEVRSTIKGILGRLQFPEAPSDSEVPAYHALVNVVVGDPEDRVRKLPTVYFGKSPIFTSRNLDEVTEKLSRTVEAIVRADDTATYLLHPCELDGRRGLYGYDFHNRSTYRRQLERAGMVFSNDPFATFTAADRFSCADWGEFSPEFLILRNAPDFTEDPDEVIYTRGGQLAFIASSYRIGSVTPNELTEIVRMLSDVAGFSAENPLAVLRALSS